MPGLLDLPPELIEQIFDKCEEVAYEEWCTENDEDDYLPPKSGVPPFRSTCRYIERATCRRFAEVYLGDGHLEIAAKDADIKKFCAQARVQEFAANKKRLSFGFDEDGSARASLDLEASRSSDSCHSSSRTAAHQFDEATGALVPLHLYRNRDAIVEALRACKNFTTFLFSRNWADGDEFPTRLQFALAADNEDEHPNEPALFDITSSVAYVLSLAEEAGTCLEHIFVSDVWPGVEVGLTDGAFLVRHKDVFRNLKFFGLKFIKGSSENLDEAGSTLGKQVNEALAHMPALHTFNLEISPAISIPAWSQIANGPATTLLTLKELRLHGCDMDMRDFSEMLTNMPSLTNLFLSDAHLYKGFRDDLAQAFLGLANGPCELEVFTLSFGGIFMGELEEIIFPSSLHKPDSFPLESRGEIEDEDEWVVVEIQPWIYWKGKEDIKWVLREMAAYIRSL